MRISSSATVIMRNMALGLFLMSLASQCYGEVSDLQEGYYTGKCIQKSSGLRGLFNFQNQPPRPVNVEETVASIVWRRYDNDNSIVAALLRMQFHDCFVNGCDASILLDGDDSEKTAPPNLSVRGFDIIDEIKDKLESICPGVVSCADIIAMATRDAVYFASENRGYTTEKYMVQTGRKDGYESLASNVVDLPPSTASASDAITAFAKKGLNAVDLVYLLGGGHSVGVTHCGLIQNRLSNFSNTGKPDPSMNQRLVADLRRYCDNQAKPVNLDVGTPLTVDTSLYEQVLYWNKGILRVDQDLASNTETRPTVLKIVSGYEDFSANFWQAMVKLQAVGVVGSQGEVRTSCNAVNGR